MDQAGATRSVDLALLDGVTTRNRNRAIRRNAGWGALGGLVAGGLTVMCLQLCRAVDDRSDQGARASSLAALEIDALVSFTVAGAILGLVSGYRNPEEMFQFGAGAR